MTHTKRGSHRRGMSGRKWYERGKLAMAFQKQIKLPVFVIETDTPAGAIGDLAREYALISDETEKRNFAINHLSKSLRRLQADGRYLGIDGRVYDD